MMWSDGNSTASGATTGLWDDTHCHGTGTWPVVGLGYWQDEPIRCHADPYLYMEMPWIFDTDRPWMSPSHYPPAPKKLTYSNDAVMVVSHRIKQPYRMGFKRGNRL